MEKEFDQVYWNKLKSKLKQEYPLLTNADLLWRHNTKEELLRTIALKLGKTSKEMLAIIEMD
jgi:hypothetical protein